MKEILQINHNNENEKSQENTKAQIGFISSLADGWFDSALEINNLYNFKEDFFKSKEVREAAEKGFMVDLLKGYVDRALEIQNYFKFNNELLTEMVQDGFFKNLLQGGGTVESAIKIKDAFGLLSENFIKTTVKESLIKTLSSGGNIYQAVEIKKYFKLEDDFLNSKEVMEAAQKGLIENLSTSHIGSALVVKNNFKITEEFLNSKEVQDAAQKGFIENMISGEGYKKDAEKIKANFNFKENPEITQKKFIDYLSGGAIDYANKIKEIFNLEEDFLKSKEVQEAAKKGLIKELSVRSNFNEALKIKDAFGLEEDFLKSKEVQEAAEKGYLHFISGGWFSHEENRLNEIRNNFNLGDDFLNSKEVMEAVEKGFISKMSYGTSANEFKEAIKFKDLFKIDEKFIQDFTYEKFINFIISGSEDRASKLKEDFHLNFPPQKIFYEIEKRLIGTKFDIIKEKFPKLYSSIEKSTELLATIIRLIKELSLDKLEKTIDQNPFLQDALEGNTRYGSKLFLKYIEFDNNSKDNIKTLFDFKNEIIKDNPELDPNSVQFRTLIQEKLIKYRKNQKIINEMNGRGVNTSNFLNYGKELSFILGEQEDVSFSEKIKTPITRIKETLTKYQEILNNILGEYKQELISFKIENPEKEKLIEQIKDLENKISIENDEKKLGGMRKGLESLKLKLNSLKQINIWDKIQSDLFRLKSMIENIFKYHDLCVSGEEKVKDIKDRKELIKEKDILEKNVNQLKINFKEFETFFEEYENKLKVFLMPILNEDRTLSLIQAIKENLGEELNHYDTDKNDINKIFFDENGENDNKLNGTEMKVCISARNPDIDLYLGNYCPCCICIESTHHGEESPISDYVTDLGMQNIIVYDEKREMPVVACWTFIGENKKDGKPILVIDNIEANTEYTNNYPEQLKEKIESFFIEYAKASNIDKIIQGEHNNDLIVFKTKEVNQKLGGLYNRGDGYFLEAESDEDDN